MQDLQSTKKNKTSGNPEKFPTLMARARVRAALQRRREAASSVMALKRLIALERRAYP
jgi:hypothetical protein